jgi:NodT family efflux transporter outer membrane factor (OMF) lipoprotein
MVNFSFLRVQSAGASFALLLLAGCAVGPDFKKPAAPEVSDYTAAKLSTTAASPGTVGGDAQRFITGDVSADWWTAFHSQTINDLVELALKNNSDLKAAQAALKAAHESARAQYGAFLPSVSAGFSGTRQLTSGALAPVPSDNTALYNLFTPQVSISYMPDIFGLTRRTVESFDAQAQAVRFQMLATYITLINNVVATAIQEASTQEQIDATRQMVAAETKSLEILQYQFDKGYASGVDLAAQKSALATTAATLPPLVKQLAQQHDLLAVLTGRYPSQVPEEKLDLASIQLPQDMPVSLPSDLVAQRPDIMQAQSNLHSASAQIGIAIANRLPNLQLTGVAGNSALAFSQLFTPGTDFWSIGAALTAPIFQGGTLLHQERAARATYEQDAQLYRSAVLGAFQNVADSLVALQQDAEGLKAAAASEAAAKLTLDLTQRLLTDGYTGTQGLLTAQQAYQQARIALVQAQANRYADTAALFQALGGGWWHRTDLNGNNHDK